MIARKVDVLLSSCHTMALVSLSGSMSLVKVKSVGCEEEHAGEVFVNSCGIERDASGIRERVE